MTLENPFEGKRPMICPDCGVAYYRDTTKDGWPCDFCGSDGVHPTTHMHIMQLVNHALMLDKIL